MLFDKPGGQLRGCKSRMIQDQVDKIDIGDHPFNMISVQGADERHPRGFAGLSPADHLGQQGIIVDADNASGDNTAVHPDAPSPGRGVPGDHAGCRHKIPGRIFGADPGLDGRPVKGDIFLTNGEHFPVGDFQLKLHKIQAGHKLRYRMLHLKPRVHLQKIHVQVFIQNELNGPGIGVPGFPRKAAGHGSHFAAQVRGPLPETGFLR